MELLGIIKAKCGFRCNRSTNDQIFCIHQILKKELQCDVTARLLFTNVNEAYYLVRSEVLYVGKSSSIGTVAVVIQRVAAPLSALLHRRNAPLVSPSECLSFIPQFVCS
jgi:hypothetical protein